MRTLILSIVHSIFFLLNCQNSYSQENCKYNVDKKDPFTDKPVRAIITPIKFSVLPTYNWQLFLYKDGDTYHIETSLAFAARVNDFLEVGDSIRFKFESGKIITAYSRDRITPLLMGSEESSSRVTAYQNVYFPISNEDFAVFSTSPVSFVQMNTGHRVYQEKVNEKNAKKIMNAALCVMK